MATNPLLEHTIFINLEHRVDRCMQVKHELHCMGIKDPIRLNAVKMEYGVVGKTMSHLKCLELAKERNFPQVFICEDDMYCIDVPGMLTRMDAFYKEYGNTNAWDVLIVAGNNYSPYTILKDGLIQVHNCQTTTGYIVQRHYYDKLLNNYRDGLKKLLKEPEVRHLYAIDAYWKHLQRTDRWLALTPFAASQRPSYSDIDHRVVDYSEDLLKYDK